jgi:peptidyl-dipeptidase Dcp
MKQQLAEIASIANDPASPTFANTIEAMERSGALLRRVIADLRRVDRVEHESSAPKIDGEGSPRSSLA